VGRVVQPGSKAPSYEYVAGGSSSPLVTPSFQ
jgi:hypothetical protein